MTANRQQAELILIRHAPIAVHGVLCGRTDVAAKIDLTRANHVRSRLPGVAQIVTSPAQRCVQTAQALWPDHTLPQDIRLWEQDFGVFDGKSYDQFPDLGVMRNEDLAKYQPPQGESFADLCDRTRPALAEWSARAFETQKPVVLVVHAGVIRSALGVALGHAPAGLSFEIGNWSVTRLRAGQEGPFSVITTNEIPS